jgi:hypothetical protein
MAQKDITEKILEDYNDVFADIINVLIFNGERRVNPSSLQNAQVHSQYKDDKSILHEEERDVFKYWTDYNVKIALCGIENQSKVEKKMPLRVIGYEGASYRSQLSTAPIPVITIILYFGTEHRWNAPRTLKELFKIPEGMEEYVNDCRIHVFEVAWLTDEQVQMFRSDFKVVANFFVNKRRNKNYQPDDKTEIQHVDEVLKLLSVMAEDKRYESILVDKKEVRNMCDVAQRLEDRGRAEGRTEDIERMLRKGKTPEEIADFCGYDLAEVQAVADAMLATV